MAEKRTLQILIEAKDNASKQLKGLNGQLKAMQPAFQKMALFGTASFVAIGAGINKTVQDAMIAEGAIAKFNAVFKEGSEDMMSFVKDIRKEMPSSTTEIIKMASGLQDLLVPIGIARDEAQEMSKEFLDLSNKIGAFNDVNPTEVLDAMRSGLTGISMPLKRFGIDSSIVSLEALAMKEGLIGAKESFASLTPEVRAQVRAQALLIQITKQSDDAIQGFAENQDSALRRQQEIKASLEDLSNFIGDIFLPIVDDLLKQIIPVIKQTMEWVKANPKLIKTVVSVGLVITGLIALLGTLGIAFFGVSTAIAFLLANPVVFVITGVIAVIMTLGYAIIKLRSQVESWGDVWKFIWIKAQKVFYNFVNIIVSEWNELLKLIGFSDNIFGDFADKIQAKTKALENQAQSLKNKTEEVKDEVVKEGKAFETTGEQAKGLAENTAELSEKSEEAKDKITSLYEKLKTLATGFKEEDKRNQSEHVENIVNMVADAEEEKLKLQEDYKKLISDYEKQEAKLSKKTIKQGYVDDVKALRESTETKKKQLQSYIDKQQTIIDTYSDSQMNLDKNIAERKRYLNMNELEQLNYDYQKKQKLSKRNYLIETALSLLKIQKLKSYLGEMLTQEVLYSTNVISEAILVTEKKKDELEKQTNNIAKYLNKQTVLYKNHNPDLSIRPYTSLKNDYASKNDYTSERNIVRTEAQEGGKSTIINIDLRGATVTDEELTERLSNNLLKNLSYAK